MSRRSLVLDASAAVHLVAMEVRWQGLDRYAFHAPPLMWSEALSALAQATYRREMPASALGPAVERLEALPVRMSVADAQHRRTALEIALELGWAKTYDAEYVALARSLHCSLLTTDHRLLRGAGDMIDVVGPLDIA